MRSHQRGMIREADTIEFGIKSTVWNRANGLCNFNGILRPKVMASNDSDDITLNTPVMNRYFARTSCFFGVGTSCRRVPDRRDR